MITIVSGVAPSDNMDCVCRRRDSYGCYPGRCLSKDNFSILLYVFRRDSHGMTVVMGAGPVGWSPPPPIKRLLLRGEGGEVLRRPTKGEGGCLEEGYCGFGVVG